MKNPLKTVKAFAENHTKAFLLMLAGVIMIVMSSIFFFHGMWQLDMICVGPVWSYPPLTNYGYAWMIPQYPWSVIRYADQYFQDGPLFTPLFGGTIGGGYDFMLGMMAVAWALGMVGIAVLMFGVIQLFSDKTQTKLWKFKPQNQKV